MSDDKFVTYHFDRSPERSPARPFPVYGLLFPDLLFRPWHPLLEAVGATVIDALREKQAREDQRAQEMGLRGRSDLTELRTFLDRFDDHMAFMTYLEDEVRRLRRQVEDQYVRAERAIEAADAAKSFTSEEVRQIVGQMMPWSGPSDGARVLAICASIIESRHQSGHQGAPVERSNIESQEVKELRQRLADARLLFENGCDPAQILEHVLEIKR